MGLRRNRLRLAVVAVLVLGIGAASSAQGASEATRPDSITIAYQFEWVTRR